MLRPWVRAPLLTANLMVVKPRNQAGTPEPGSEQGFCLCALLCDPEWPLCKWLMLWLPVGAWLLTPDSEALGFTMPHVLKKHLKDTN